jgi:hypothetical protein
MTTRKRTNKDLQNITHKTKDGVTRIPLKTGGELRCSMLFGNSEIVMIQIIIIGGNVAVPNWGIFIGLTPHSSSAYVLHLS